ARSVHADARVIAVIRNGYPALDGGLQNGLAFLDRHGAAVYRQRHSVHKQLRIAPGRTTSTPGGLAVLGCLDDFTDRPVVLADVDGAPRAGERHALLDVAIRDGYRHLQGLPLRVLEDDRDGKVEEVVAELIDPQDHVLAVDSIAQFQLRQGGAVNPPLEE